MLKRGHGAVNNLCCKSDARFPPSTVEPLPFYTCVQWFRVSGDLHNSTYMSLRFLRVRNWHKWVQKDFYAKEFWFTWRFRVAITNSKQYPTMQNRVENEVGARII